MLYTLFYHTKNIKNKGGFGIMYIEKIVKILPSVITLIVWFILLLCWILKKHKRRLRDMSFARVRELVNKLADIRSDLDVITSQVNELQSNYAVDLPVNDVEKVNKEIVRKVELFLDELRGSLPDGYSK